MNDSWWSIQRRLFGLAAGARRRVLLTALLGVLLTAGFVAQAFLIAATVGGILSGEPWSENLPRLVAIVVVVALTATVTWLREMSGVATAAAVKRVIRQRAYDHLLALGPGYTQTTRTGALQSTLVDGVEALDAYMGSYVPQLFVALLAPIAIVAYLFTLDPVVGLIVAACIVLAPSAPRLWDRVLRDKGHSHWVQYAGLTAQFLDSMQGMTTLKAFNASKQRGDELAAESNRLYRLTMAVLGIALIDSGIVGFAVTAGTALAVGVGALHVVDGSLALSSLLVILFLTRECLRPLTDLERYWHAGYQGISASGSVQELLDVVPSVADPVTSLAPPPTHAVELDFRGVTFSYRAGARPAVAELTLHVAPGETVALVGRSGAGKSTIAALIYRFFDPQAGSIALNGLDLRHWSLDKLRAMTAVVAQDTYLFHGTVADNLLLAKPDATHGELEEAARAANAHAFISRLPNGYDTIVGERGVKLSGGERQRIAIARALLKDAPLLVLDEATSNIDAANEAVIQDALGRLALGRTTLVIAHRLSTIVNADRIVVLDQGHVVESGPHRDLVSRNGAYAQLVAAQQEVPA
jgi:ATP-binding cassette, subfamily C, bacterial CydD